MHWFNPMPETVTRFAKDKKHIDSIKNRLKPDAFWNKKSPYEISVVSIDKEKKLASPDVAIFAIGDLVYATVGKPSLARGDMNRQEIEAITCDPAAGNLFLEHFPVKSIEGHYNIKINSSLSELIIKINVASRLSHVATLVVR